MSQVHHAFTTFQKEVEAQAQEASVQKFVDTCYKRSVRFRDEFVDLKILSRSEDIDINDK